MMISKKTTLKSASIFVCGALIGFFITHFATATKPLNDPVEVRMDSANFNFVNPFLFEKTDKRFFSSEFTGLLDSLNKYLSSKKADKSVTDASVYFRDLNTGHWTGLNEDDTYEPSSMLKIVTFLAMIKVAETNPSFLDKKINYTPADTTEQNYKPKTVLAAGNYSVKNLGEEMIVDSDNGADYALLANQDINREFWQLYNIFRLPLPTGASADFMSARSYSVIFRTLYNATLLPANESDQILELLTRTNFTQGLVAGLPAGTVVAHKFGERTEFRQDGTVVGRELHDCGIVYYPSHPYLICVMTKGQDFTTLSSVISDVSKIVYGYVAKK